MTSPGSHSHVSWPLLPGLLDNCRSFSQQTFVRYTPCLVIIVITTVYGSFWRRQWHPTPFPLLPGKSHGRRSLVGCSPWGHEESNTTEQLHFHFSLSCIGEGNGNPLQCSCLENPGDEGTWWAAIYGVAQSRTRLKRLSSSSMGPLRQLLSTLCALSPFTPLITHEVCASIVSMLQGGTLNLREAR